MAPIGQISRGFMTVIKAQKLIIQITSDQHLYITKISEFMQACCHIFWSLPVSQLVNSGTTSVIPTANQNFPFQIPL